MFGYLCCTATDWSITWWLVSVVSVCCSSACYWLILSLVTNGNRDLFHLVHWTLFQFNTHVWQAFDLCHWWLIRPLKQGHLMSLDIVVRVWCSWSKKHSQTPTVGIEGYSQLEYVRNMSWLGQIFPQYFDLKFIVNRKQSKHFPSQNIVGIFDLIKTYS